MVVTAFEGGGFSRHSCEQGVYSLNQNTVRRINNKGGGGRGKVVITATAPKLSPKGDL